MLQLIYIYFPFYFIYLPLLDLILAINEHKGIDNPLAHVGCKYLFVCVGTFDGCLRDSPTGSINIGSLPREILSTTILHHPSSSRKSQRLSQVAEEFLAPLSGRLHQKNTGLFTHI